MLIEIRLLGRFSARRGVDEIPPGAFRQRLTRSLVQVLLTRRGSYVSREALTRALWPKLAVARGDPDASRTTAEALALAEEAGHLLSARRLRQLLGPLPARTHPAVTS